MQNVMMSNYLPYGRRPAMKDLFKFIITNKFSFILILISFFIFITIFLIMRFKYPYQSAKKHGFTIASIALFIAIVYGMEIYAHFTEIEAWLGIADNILSGSIFAILCIVFWKMENRIKIRFEDAEKLRQDYGVLADKYDNDNLIKATNRDGSVIKYPIINLGTGVISLGQNYNRQILLKDDQHDYYTLPQLIINNYSDIFSVHELSNIYNNLNIRVRSMQLNNNILELNTMRTTYFDSLVTNRAADYNFSEGLSIRELYEMGPKMLPLEKSKLSNHLGFNGFVESDDGYIVFVKRSLNVSIGKQTYGDSIGASLKTKYALNDDGDLTYQGLRNAIIEEIHNELKIDVEDMDLNTLSVIAAYRDCVECGKPQLLVYVKASITAKEMNSKFTDKLKEKYNSAKKLSKRQRKELKTLEDGKKLIWVHKNDLRENIIYCYDGIKMDKLSKEGFLSVANGKMKTTTIHFLKMVPSASASIFILREMLKLPRIIESYICGKYENQDLCEDGLFINSNIIAVIDGVTAKGKIRMDDKTTGRFAMEVIKKALEKGVPTESPTVFFSALNDALKNSLYSYLKYTDKDLPRASIIAYIIDKNEIWSYGDCKCIVGNDYFSHEKIIDAVLGNKRAAVIEKELAASDAAIDLSENDIGRNAIMDDLIDQLEYENIHKIVDGNDYGYPVLNGKPICEDMIAVHKVPKDTIVVLASDGYPVLKATLSESEEELEKLIETDPYCFKTYKSTKGLAAGCLSFDDRTYIRFLV